MSHNQAFLPIFLVTGIQHPIVVIPSIDTNFHPLPSAESPSSIESRDSGRGLRYLANVRSILVETWWSTAQADQFAHPYDQTNLRKKTIIRTMFKLVAFLVLFVETSWAQKDPLHDFCRRFGHQTAVVDQKLFIDGGQVDWNPIAQNNQNYTSKLDLSSSAVQIYGSGHHLLRIGT